MVLLSHLEIVKDVTKEISKSISNKLMFCGGGGKHYLVLNKI